MKTKQCFKYILIIFFFCVLQTPIFAGTVGTEYKYSWSDNIGYVNFENVIVTDTHLSGYAWSKTHGWIKLNPQKGGVANDGAGNLSGSAWGEHLGWIDFDNVSIDISTGKFSGTATGDFIGTLTFDCPTYCNVQTDWRPATIEEDTLVEIPPTNVELPEYVETLNESLTIYSIQTGKYIKDTEDGQIVLVVPFGSITTKVTFYIEVEPLDLNDESLVNVYAKDDNGNYITSFSKPLSLTLPIPESLRGLSNLSVSWYNETNAQWVLIPDAVFGEDVVTFGVDHLTKFAILGDNINDTEEIYENITNEIDTKNSNYYFLLIPLFAILIIFVLVKRKNNS